MLLPLFILLAKIDINSEITKQKLKKRDMNEAQTRLNKIDPKLRDDGWGMMYDGRWTMYDGRWMRDDG